AGDAFDLRLTAELALRTHFARHPGHFGGERVELVDHRIDRVFELEDFAVHVDGDLLRMVGVGRRGRHFGDVAHLAGEVDGHQVHIVGEVGPVARNARHLRLATELAFSADLAGHTGDFGGEAVELVDHDVDGVLQLEDFALHVDRDLL